MGRLRDAYMVATGQVSFGPPPTYRPEEDGAAHGDLGGNRGPLTRGDIESFADAADGREPPAIEQLRAAIIELSIEKPMAMARMRRDLDWVLKRMRKKGVRWSR